MAGIDWTSGRVDLVHLIEVSYLDAGGDPQTARWCGPRSRARSGVAAGPTGTRHQWESRVDSCVHDWTLGPLSVAVQALSDLDLRVTTAGGDDALLEAAQRGRWRGRPIRMWLWDRASDSYQQRFEGIVDRDPGDVSWSGFSLRGTATMEIDRPWPGTRWPADTAAWTHHDAAVLSGAPDAYGGVLHQFHPGAVGADPTGYHSVPRLRGLRVGPVFGSAVWREVASYGVGDCPDSPGTFRFFFHVSPQFGCYVDRLYWDDIDSAVVRGVDDDPATLPVVETFDNLDPASGPLGTNCVLAYAAPALVTNFWTEPYPRAYARIYGPDRGHSALGTATDGGRIHRLPGSGGILRADHELLRHILDDPQMMAMGGSEWGTGAPLHLALGPDGPSGTMGYADLAGAVPREIGAGLAARNVLGEFCMLIQADLVLRWDPAQGAMKLYALRRRPSVGPMAAADWTIRRADLVHGGHPGAIPDCRQDSDPDGAYATDVEVIGATRGTAPETVAAGNPVDNIAPVTHESGRHLDAAETALGTPATRTQSIEWWSHFDPGGIGWLDGVEFLGAMRSQPQRWLRATLGWHHFGLELCDTLAYSVPGVLDAVGQVRGLRYDYGRGTVLVRSWHGIALSGALPSGG